MPNIGNTLRDQEILLIWQSLIRKRKKQFFLSVAAQLDVRRLYRILYEASKNHPGTGPLAPPSSVLGM
jgi:hypothetical protein